MCACLPLAATAAIAASVATAAAATVATAAAAASLLAACIGVVHVSPKPCRITSEHRSLGYTFSRGVRITRYASGMGFIMTHDVARHISDNAAVLYKGFPEDAVVGLWLAGTNFKVQHDTRLHDWAWKKCSDQSIIIHKHDYGTVDEDGVMRSCFPHRWFSILG